jgi:hypothetical protein
MEKLKIKTRTTPKAPLHTFNFSTKGVCCPVKLQLNWGSVHDVEVV